VIPSRSMAEEQERRSRVIVRKGRLGDPEEEDFDLLYWDAIPAEDRLDFMWELSLAQWSLLVPDVERREGLYRSVARVVRP
jgi:hypothetical protein